MDFKEKVLREMTDFYAQEEAISWVIKYYKEYENKRKKEMDTRTITKHINNCWYAKDFIELPVVVEHHNEATGKFAIAEPYIHILEEAVRARIEKSDRFTMDDNGVVTEIQPTAKPEPTQEVTKVIANLQLLTSSKFNHQDLVTLLNFKTKLSRKKIESVLASINGLAKQYKLTA